LEIEYIQEGSSLSISVRKEEKNPFVSFYQGKSLVFPVLFLTDDMKRKFSELVDVNKRYLILDEFCFFILFFLFICLFFFL
jgi:hypothetical protein